jgi:hypothetical protein
VVISGATPPVAGQSLAALGASSAGWIHVPEWETIVTGAGPHTLVTGKINRYNNSGGGMTLYFPAGASDGDVVEVKEVVNNANTVTLTTALGSTDIELVTGGTSTSDSLNVAGAWVRYKWDGNASVWRIVGKAFI